MKKFLGFILVLVISINVFAADSQDIVDNFVKQNNVYLDSLNKKCEDILENMLKEIPKIYNDKKKLVNYFESVQGKYEFIEGIYLAKNNEETILVPVMEIPADYKPAERPWYKNAIKNPDKIIKNDIFYSELEDKIITAFFKTVRINSKIIGVLEIDIWLDYKQNQERYDNMVKNNSEYINEQCRKGEKVINQIAKEISKYLGNKNKLMDYFSSIKDKNSFLEYVYIGMKDNTLIIYPGEDFFDGYTPIILDWYKNAVKNPDKIIRNQIYKDYLTKKYCISLTKALIINSKIVGVIGIDVGLDNIK